VITFFTKLKKILGAIHEKRNFKYSKNPMIKFVKFGAVMSICILFTVTFFGGN